MRSSGDLLSQDKIRDEFLGLLDLKAPALSFYSPYSFLHKVSKDEMCRVTFTGPLKSEITEGKERSCVGFGVFQQEGHQGRSYSAGS